MSISVLTLIIALVASVVPARASEPHYWISVRSAAPVDLGCRFTAGDLDGDGDADLLEAHGAGLRWWRSVGAPGSHIWEPAVLVLEGPRGRRPSAATAGDLNGDGIPELVVSFDDRLLHLYRNTGTAAAPDWRREPCDLDRIRLTEGTIQPHLSDLDADGDLDVAFVERNGHLGCIRNTGDAQSAEWSYVGFLFGVEMGSGERRPAPWGTSTVTATAIS